MCISIRICVEWLRLLDPEIVSAYRETVGEGEGDWEDGERVDEASDRFLVNQRLDNVRLGAPREQ